MLQTIDSAHKQRVITEAHTSGGRMHGPGSAITRFLPQVIHQGEHIQSIVHGLYAPSGPKKPVVTMDRAMLIASDQQIRFLNHLGSYTMVDNIDYDMVSGVNVIVAGPFASVSLLTRSGVYELEYASAASIRRFANYVNSRHEVMSSNKRGTM